jgi:cell division protein FtsB
MSLTPSTPTPEGHDVIREVEVSPLPRWVVVLFVVAFALLGYLVYASYAERQELHRNLSVADQRAQALAAELDKTNARIADLKGQMDVTTQKLGLTEDELARARSLAQTIRRQQMQSDANFRKQLGGFQQDTASKFGQVSTDLTNTKSDLSATKADLEATKNKLQSTIGDLGVQSGLIARNHDEVEELKRLGQRDIFEFTMGKTKKPQRLGPILVQFRKFDAKHYRYTMDVVVDDKKVEKKDKTIGEPVQFYVQGARAPYEIVVFNLTKKEAKGYLSTPKSPNEPAPSASAGQPSSN